MYLLTGDECYVCEYLNAEKKRIVPKVNVSRESSVKSRSSTPPNCNYKGNWNEYKNVHNTNADFEGLKVGGADHRPIFKGAAYINTIPYFSQNVFGRVKDAEQEACKFLMYYFTKEAKYYCIFEDDNGDIVDICKNKPVEKPEINTEELFIESKNVKTQENLPLPLGFTPLNENNLLSYVY